jgi:hypothetical protein
MRFIEMMCRSCGTKIVYITKDEVIPNKPYMCAGCHSRHGERVKSNTFKITLTNTDEYSDYEGEERYFEVFAGYVEDYPVTEFLIPDMEI